MTLLCGESAEYSTAYQYSRSKSAPEFRYPTRDLASVLLVRLAELAAQGWLFVGDDEDVRGQQHEKCVFGNVNGSKEHGLSHDGSGHTEIHRIPHVAVQGRGDEILGRGDR